MNFPKLSSFITAALIAICPVMAQNKPAEAAAPQPAVDVASLLKGLPENLAKYGDNKFISSGEFKHILEHQLKTAVQHGEVVTQEIIDKVLPRFAERYVMQEIVILEAAKQGIKPDEAEIRADIAKLKATPQGAERLKEFMDQFKAKDENAFIAQQARMLTAQKLLTQQVEKIDIPEADVKKFYDDNANSFTRMNASHILAAFSSDPTKEPTKEQEEAALKKINEVHKKLKDGGNFEALAKEHSDCPSKTNGGALPEFGKGDMVPEFEKAFLELKPNQISAPVKTRFGYHIIKSGEPKVVSFDEAKDKILQHLKEEKAPAVVNKFVEDLKKAYKVEMLVKPVAAIQPAD